MMAEPIGEHVEEPVDQDAGQLLLYCPTCGKHYVAFGAMGQWAASDSCVEELLPICWDGSHTRATVETQHA